MNKTINIGPLAEVVNNEIYTGENFEKFLRNLPPMKEEEVSRIKNSTISILSQCVAPNYEEPTYEQNTGLVLGYIQSGKTMSFTSLIALASDNDYKVVIVFAGTTNILLNQTIDRLGEDLDDKNEYVIIEESSLNSLSRIKRIVKNTKRQRTIILPILKHYKHIERIYDLFNHPELNLLLPKLGVLIIDDEADQASLNGFARRNWKKSLKRNREDIHNDDEKSAFDYSTTYNTISNLKKIIPNHSYIQYTATPQANLLLGQRDLLRPSWCEVLDPGNKYQGGERFFNDDLDLIYEIDKENFKNQEDPEMPENLRHAFRLFLVESALLGYDFKGKNRIKDKVELTSMMIHADRLIVVNDIYLRWLKAYNKNIIKDLDDNQDETIEDFKKIFLDVKLKLDNYFSIFPDFNEVIEIIKDYVIEELEFWFVAGKENNEVNWKRCSHHVLVGGQKLDRGFTVKNLIVTYMPRNTKSKSNADTIEQRCRFFGYKKDYIEACKVYLPQESIDEFEEYVEYEKHLRDYLKNYSIDEFYDNDRLMKLGILNPTSANKIPGELFRNDFRSFNYFQPDFENKEHNDKITNQFLKSSFELGILKPTQTKNHQEDNKHILFETTKDQAIKLLNNVKFNSKRDQLTKSQFLTLLNKNKNNKKVWLIKIAHERDANGGRPRSIKNDGRIKSLASNRPPSFGDRDLLINTDDFNNFKKLYKNEPIIQIHKIQIKDNQSYPPNLKKHVGKSLNIIATVFPSHKNDSSFISALYD
tara:strand:+ start:3286 stop:5556 length:2271 start_codon:yes stop_codon:yes gene_type:complete